MMTVEQAKEILSGKSCWGRENLQLTTSEKRIF